MVEGGGEGGRSNNSQANYTQAGVHRVGYIRHTEGSKRLGCRVKTTCCTGDYLSHGISLRARMPRTLCALYLWPLVYIGMRFVL
jgi:hypothetical protein